ncbi:MAG: DUF4880 domain-containing protein [Rhodobacteraceae bacterium]|nr:DUF4880 domain-containing protein [Paracoccaceae bacterium]MBR9822979.1 DUF4880 domain-containing protein [Paracoccaceae bacterium]
MTGRAQSKSGGTASGGTDDRLLREALEWLVRLRDEHVTLPERRAFESWLARDERHRAAWAEATALWERFEPVRARAQAMRRQDRAMSRRDLLRGAGALTVVGTGSWALLARGGKIGTAPGEIRKLILTDGTRVILGARSTLETPSEGGAVTLHRGAAFFERASRVGAAPLQIAADGARITCAAGAFDLALWPDRVTLAVALHAVTLHPDRADTTPRHLDAGWHTSVRDGAMTAPAPVPPSTIGAWRDGRLVFRNAPLSEVLAALDRYRGGRLLCLDAATPEIPVTAVLEAATPDAALRAVTDSLGLTLVPLPGGLTLVRA